MSRLGSAIMIGIFWTGLANGPAGASSDRPMPPSRSMAAPEIEPSVVDLWLADVAACEAGVQHRCAPVLR